jgi:hypothetical protein
MVVSFRSCQWHVEPDDGTADAGGPTALRHDLTHTGSASTRTRRFVRQRPARGPVRCRDGPSHRGPSRPERRRSDQLRRRAHGCRRHRGHCGAGRRRAPAQRRSWRLATAESEGRACQRESPVRWRQRGGRSSRWRRRELGGRPRLWRHRPRSVPGPRSARRWSRRGSLGLKTVAIHSSIAGEVAGSTASPPLDAEARTNDSGHTDT